MHVLLRRSAGLTLSTAGITGVLIAFAFGLPAIHGNPGPIVVGLAAAAMVAAVARATTGPDDRAFVVRAAVGAFALRAAVAAILYEVAVSIGRGGAVTGDDGAYADLAWAYVRYLRGEGQPPDVPPIWNGQAYLFGTFIYLESAVFWVVGREMLAMQFINASLAALTYVALFDMGRRLFGARPARLTLALAAVYPSLVLWSSLNLKEAFVVAAVTTVLWLLLRLGAGVGWRAVLISYILIHSLESMRSYSFMGLLIIVPIGIVLARGIGPWRRVRMAAAAIALSGLLLTASPWVPWATDLSYAIENIDYARRGQAESARTAFVEPRALPVAQGETLYVPATESSPIALAAMPSPPTLYYVKPGTKVVLASASPAPTAASPAPTVVGGVTVAAIAAIVVTDSSVVAVKPGDIVVVGTPDMTPAPEAQSRKLSFVDQRGGERSATLDFVPPPHSEPEALIIDRTLAHLPAGVTHAFFAPFPWEARRLSEAALVPEMLFWYALLVGAAWTVWTRRRDWRTLAPIVFYLAGVFALFSLLEGNVGTLYRHRTMLVPYVVMLAAPAIVAAADRARRSAGTRRRAG